MAKKKAKAAKPPDHDLVAGAYWRRDYVAWGSRSKPKHTRAIHGYWNKQAKVGAPGAATKSEKTVDVWNLNTVYVLLNGSQVEYVGEGKLGAELKRYLDDPLKHWDRFSWFAPAQYSLTHGKGAIKPSMGKALSVKGKKLIEFLELVLIHGGQPNANRQVPKKAGRILWLTQTRAPGAIGSIEDRLSAISTSIAELKPSAPASKKKKSK